jgi:hypothetical protein
MASMPSGISLRRLSVLISSSAYDSNHALETFKCFPSSPSIAHATPIMKVPHPTPVSNPVEYLTSISGVESSTGSHKRASIILASINETSALGFCVSPPDSDTSRGSRIIYGIEPSANLSTYATDGPSYPSPCHPVPAMEASILSPTFLASLDFSSCVSNPPVPHAACLSDPNEGVDSSYETPLLHEDPAMDPVLQARRLRVQPSIACLIIPDTALFRTTSTDLPSTATTSTAVFTPSTIVETPSTAATTPCTPAPMSAKSAPDPPYAPGPKLSIRNINGALSYVSQSLNTLDNYQAQLKADVVAGTARRDKLRQELERAQKEEARERQMARWAVTMQEKGHVLHKEDSTQSFSSVIGRRAMHTSEGADAGRRQAVVVSEANVDVSALGKCSIDRDHSAASISAVRIFSREASEPFENGMVDDTTGLWRIPSLSKPEQTKRGIKDQVLRGLTIGKRVGSRLSMFNLKQSFK